MPLALAPEYPVVALAEGHLVDARDVLGVDEEIVADGGSFADECLRVELHRCVAPLWDVFPSLRDDEYSLVEVVNDVLHGALDDEPLELQRHLGEVHNIDSVNEAEVLAEPELLYLGDDNLKVLLEGGVDILG